MNSSRKNVSQGRSTPLTSPRPLNSTGRATNRGYSESYRDICSEIKVVPSTKISSDLRKCELKVNLDELKSTDLKSLQAALPCFPLLKKVYVWGQNFTEIIIESETQPSNYRSRSLVASASEPNYKSKSPRKHYKVPNPTDKSDSEIHIDPGSVCNSRNISFTAKILKSIALNMGNNTEMTEIKLIGLKISKVGWNFLSSGLESQSPISSLVINFCKLRDEDLCILIAPLMQNKTLKVLDLSSNELEESCGYEIGRVINMQRERRDHEIWLSGLRGSKIENISTDGLEDLNLANNRLKDKAIYDLCHTFYHDTYLRSLDLRKNCISLDGIRELLSLLYSNTTLIYVDIRENLNEEQTGILKALISKLRKNFSSYRKQNQSAENALWGIRLMELQQAVEPILISESNSPKTERQAPKRVNFKNDYSECSDEYKNSSQDIHIQQYNHHHNISESDPDESESYIRPRQGLGYDHRHPELQENGEKAYDQCPMCQEYERALFKTESNCVSLNLENARLKKQIESMMKNERNQQSWSNSAISRVDGPVFIPQPESISVINGSVSII